MFIYSNVFIAIETFFVKHRWPQWSQWSGIFGGCFYYCCCNPGPFTITMNIFPRRKTSRMIPGVKTSWRCRRCKTISMKRTIKWRRHNGQVGRLKEHANLSFILFKSNWNELTWLTYMRKFGIMHASWNRCLHGSVIISSNSSKLSKRSKQMRQDGQADEDILKICNFKNINTFLYSIIHYFFH